MPDATSDYNSYLITLQIQAFRSMNMYTAYYYYLHIFSVALRASEK